MKEDVMAAENTEVQRIMSLLGTIIHIDYLEEKDEF
jgi:hypothetical protein